MFCIIKLLRSTTFIHLNEFNLDAHRLWYNGISVKTEKLSSVKCLLK